MLAISKLLQERLQERPGYAPLVDSLLQRVSESALAEDRREALLQLRDLLGAEQEARVAFGSVGLPVMVALIRDGRDDVDQLRVALECLSSAVGPEGETVAAVNAEQLLRSTECVAVLLSLLDDEPLGSTDFYVRFYSLDVLKALLAANAALLQERVLSAPLGVVRLMGMLSERDALRNEALLLLQQLVGGNAELQKMAAFEGAFDRILAIVGDEGLLEGGIVVQDCLQLLFNLLRDNSSNQLMFREMGFLAHLASLLGATAGEAGHLHPDSQPCHNLVGAVQVFTALLTPAEPPTAATQAQCEQNRQQLMQQHADRVLMGLALGSPPCPDAHVRAQALLCLAGMLPLELDRAVVERLIGIALHTPDGAEAAAAETLLEALYTGSAAAQMAVAFGLPGELPRTLSRSDLRAASAAASVLSYLLRGNAEVKQHLARQLGPQLAACVQQLAGLLLAQHRDSAARLAAARYLRLLLSWLPGCTAAVVAFLQAATARPFLVGIVAASPSQFPDTLLQGMVALLLGVCALERSTPTAGQPSSPAAAGTPTGAMLTDVIVSQIGMDQFNMLLGVLKRLLAVAGPVGAAEPGSAPPGSLLVTCSFYTYITGLADAVSRGLAGGPGAQTVAHTGTPPPLPPLPMQPGPPMHPPSWQPAAAPSSQPQLRPATASVGIPPPPTFINPPPAYSQAPPTYIQPQQMQSLLPPPVRPISQQQQPQPVNSRPPSVASAAASPGPASSSMGAGSHTPWPGTQDPHARLSDGASSAQPSSLHAPTSTAPASGYQQHQHQQALSLPPNGMAVAPAGPVVNDHSNEELRQLKEELKASQKEVAQSKVDAAQLRDTVVKLESELEDLSNAYAMIEAHSKRQADDLDALQAQLEERAKHARHLEEERAQHARQLEEERAQHARQLEEERAQHAQRLEVEVERTKQAVEAADAAANGAAATPAGEDGDDGALEDLLVCLGQEEEKVARLCASLSELGVDPEPIIRDLIT